MNPFGKSKIFGKIENGMCRLSGTGGIAVKTSNGYKSYDVKKNKLTNCDNFVIDLADDFFFVIPTNKVEKGDIILVHGKPKCVISADKNEIKVINYENSTIDTVVPERHIFMGNTYFYGKIVSMLGSNLGKGKKGINKIMSYVMLSSMMGGNNGNGGMFGVGNNMMPLLLMGNGGMEDMFSGIFDFDCDDDEDEDEEETAEKENE